MATFFAVLPAGHAIRAATTLELAAGLRAEAMITGAIPAAIGARKEWASAIEYLTDATVCKDVATLVALSTGQRATLCAMLGAVSSSDAQTAASRIVRLLNVQPVPVLPLTPSPWRDTLVLMNSARLAAADVLTAAEICAELAGTPFTTAGAGLVLTQLKEVGYCAIWAHDHLVDQTAWDSLPPVLQLELRAHLGVAAGLGMDWACAACLAICSVWRSRLVPQHVAVRPTIVAALPTTHQGSMVSSSVTGGIMLPLPISAAAVAGGEAPWWVPSGAGGVRKVEWTGLAQNNILSPHHLGEPTTMGSSAWEPLTAGVQGALLEAVVEGVGTCDTPQRRADLQAILLAAVCTVVDADLIIDAAESTALRASRKQESDKRRKATPTLASYPWLQSFGGVSNLKGSSDSLTMGKQLAVALRADGAESLGEIQEWVRQVRAAKFQSVFALFDTALDALNALAVGAALEAFKDLVKETITLSYNDALAVCRTFPESIHLREVCAGRQRQLKQLPTIWEQLNVKQRSIASGAAGSDFDSDLAWRMGWIHLLFDGARASTSVAASIRTIAEEKGGNFRTGPSCGVRQAPAVSPGSSGGGSSTTPGGAGSGPVTRGGGVAPGAGAPKAAKPAKIGLVMFGVHFPISKDVIGDMIGIEGPVKPCWDCKQQGHSAGECPVVYGRAGKPLPGWNKDGDKIAAAWHADEPRRATYKAWLAFFGDRTIFASGRAQEARVRNAPTLDQFQERADNARP